MEQAAVNEKRTAVASGYSIYLLEQGISFSHTPPYLVSGSPAGLETWLIHISIVRQQFDSYIRPILEFLKSENLPFAIPADAAQHNNILGGTIGFQLTGKVIWIAVASDDDLTGIVNKLSNLTRDIFGPAMPCAYHLTGAIAVSYGPMFQETPPSQIKKAIFYGSAIADSLKAILKTKGHSWPFQQIRPIKSYKETHLINRQYIPIETFKSDPKGNVIKALKINSIYNMQWCVLKQGRRYQSFDHSGRDAKDRLKWQYRVHQQFAGLRILPKPIAYFERYGDGFFAMEYKESVSIIERAAQLSEGKTWRSMSVENKRTMTGYLLQIVRILEIFHQEGFAHRDVTAANFIVTDAGQVFAIDIELCYDLRNAAPEPPFTLGTPGYMSPQQAAGGVPSKTDDIYSLGALLAAVLTGVLPNKLNHGNAGLLATNLAWFIESASLVSIIVSCLNRDPEFRPALKHIRHALELYDTVLLTNYNTKDDHFPAIRKGMLEDVLTVGSKTLCSLMPTFGFAELAILVLLKKYTQSQLRPAGLTGPPEPDLQWMVAETAGASISNGLAGEGLKLLYLTDHPAFTHDPRRLADIVDQISIQQHTDGSWTTNPVVPKGKQYQVTGFSHGVAGITYFLLCYYAQYGTEELRVRIYAALTWLAKQRKPADGRLIWTVSAENKTIDPWLEHGFSGIALAFIKAYEVLGEVQFKLIASAVLTLHPTPITSNYCSFGNGLAGLGEVYLEAFRVFEDEEWYKRASAVQGILLNSCYRDGKKCYWLDGTQLEPTADFWSGNSGVLHFLLRFSHPDEISFPFHLIK